MKISSTKTITEKEGFGATIYLLDYYWKLTGFDDLTDILSGSEYLEKDTPADSAFWEYWLDAIEKVKKDGFPLKDNIKNNKTITEKEGYEAMFYMLYDYWKLTKSKDLTDILKGTGYIENGTPADSAFWEYWLDAVEKVKKEGSPPLKRLKK